MNKNNNWKAWLYLAPVLILMAVFTFYPLINTFVISFIKNYDYRVGSGDGFTFDNYGIVLGLIEKIQEFLNLESLILLSTLYLIL